MTGRSFLPTIGLLALLLLAGCVKQHPEPAREPDTRGSRFTPQSSGSVTGEVRWVGELPDVPPFTVWKLRGKGKRGRFLHANPNAPAIDSATGGVLDAVVFLRGVDPTTARPWDHAPVRVEIGSDGIGVRQGEMISRVGLVRRGDAVEMLVTESELHTLRATGAATFTLPFPDPDQLLSRRLDRPGIVELTSGTGLFWYRAYLFVTDHSVCTRTDAHGQFVLSGVPEGRYELVCWLPNWNAASHDRDPESSRISRVRFHPPAEKVATVEVRAGGTTTASVELTGDDFSR